MTPASTRNITRFLALALVLATFGLTAAVSRSPFERLPHLEDEIAYLYQARIFAGGHLVIDSPQPQRSYWQPFVIDEGGRRFGKYSPGWPLLLSIGVLLGQTWIVNAALAALSVALVYRFGCNIFDPETGLVAAILTAISPIFLLLSGSLMGHTAALFWGTLFALALERIFTLRRKSSTSPGVQRRARQIQIRWAIVAGIALGMLVNTRPLTAIGIALPFAFGIFVYSIFRVIQHTRFSPHTLWTRSNLATWRLALIFAGTTVLTSSMILIHNYAAVGDLTANLYQLVWDYDRIGFCAECGRSGHTPEKAILNLRRDLALWSSDLFGWQMSEETHNSLAENNGWRLGQGLSWMLLPIGLIAGWRKGWTWLLLGAFVGLAGVHMLYWINAQVYSTRYYFEALPGLALVSALGITALARKIHRVPVYAIFVAMIAVSVIGYSPQRLSYFPTREGPQQALGFNDVGLDDIEALNALRDGRPVLILVLGEERRTWRDWGTYMALTSPYLNSDVVAARDHGWEREQILQRFPDRQVLYLTVDNVLQISE